MRGARVHPGGAEFTAWLCHPGSCPLGSWPAGPEPVVVGGCLPALNLGGRLGQGPGRGAGAGWGWGRGRLVLASACCRPTVFVTAPSIYRSVRPSEGCCGRWSLQRGRPCPLPPALEDPISAAPGRLRPSRTRGLLWQLRPSDVEVELLAHTRRVVSLELPEETGLHTGWIQNGGLFIASSRQRLDEYKRLMSVGAPPAMGLRALGRPWQRERRTARAGEEPGQAAPCWLRCSSLRAAGESDWLSSWVSRRNLSFLSWWATPRGT
uniref:Uncharacterized protein n=1 Tax=Oryctolagus cuniculus TaxID=9986 RepID=A0A5F9C3M6_RABIT